MYNIAYVMKLVLHVPGGSGPQCWHLHHHEPGREGLRRTTEAPRQPQAAVPAGGHVSAGQRADRGGDPLLRGLQGGQGHREEAGGRLQPGQVSYDAHDWLLSVM